MTSKAFTLQPWVNNLLLNYEQMDLSENLLAGQVLRVLCDSTVPGQPEAVQDAVLQVSDGSYYIRVVIAAEALQSEKNTHTQIRVSSLICRIIILQKYTVCFQEKARLEDCEFYLQVQKFIVLPIEELRLESSDGNKEPSVMQKVKKLWLRSLPENESPSSGKESSIFQLVDAVRQNRLDHLKESAKECLDLEVPKMMPATGKDDVPVTQWEAARKQEQSEDAFEVPANILVVSPEEGAIACDSSRAETSEATPRESGNGRMELAEPNVISQPSSVASTALSESPEGSMDTPWDRLPPVCLTMSCSDAEKTLPQGPPSKTKQDVAADSNAPDSLELCSQDSSEGRSPGVPVLTSSPLLSSCGNASLVQTSTTQAPSAMEAACDAPSAAKGPQVLGNSEATPVPPPVTPIFPSSSLQVLPKGMPHQEQADSNVSAFPPGTLEHGLDCVRLLRGGAVGARRKLLEGDGQTQPAHHEQRHPQGAPRGKRREMGSRLKPLSTQGAKKSRKEETRLQHGREEEEAAVVSGPSSQTEQHKALQPYKKKALQYKYEAPSPELCEQIRSVRIPKVMLKWACWILMEKDVDS